MTISISKPRPSAQTRKSTRPGIELLAAFLWALLTMQSTYAQPEASSASSASNQIVLNANGNFTARFDDAVKPYQIAVLSLEDAKSPSTLPPMLNALHRSLPLKGWRIISLPPTDRADQTIERIRAAASYLEELQTTSIALVSSAENITQTIQFAIERRQFVSGLAMWRVDRAALDWKIIEELRASRISVLDITPSGLGKSARLQRRHQFALAGFTEDYQQIVIDDALPPASSARRIRRWLENEFQK